MTLLLEENWDKDRFGNPYPVRTLDVNQDTLSGGSGWESTSYGSFWNWAYNTSPIEAITAGSQTYPGLVSAGNTLLMYARGDSQHWQRMSRPIYSQNITCDDRTYWMAFTSACYQNKNDLSLSLTGISNTSDGSTAILYKNSMSYLSRGVIYPSVATGVSDTPLWTGDASYTTHLMVYKIETYKNLGVSQIYSYVDPNLSQNPSTWQYTDSNSFIMTTVSSWNFEGGRNSSLIDSPNYFDNFRIATTWYEAVGLTTDAVNTAWIPFFWYRL